MKVSLITVTYNAARYLDDCIRSVISQDYQDIEYIIVDGKSTDQTISIIQQNGNSIHKWVSEEDCGMYDALNKGMKMATGDIIGVLNSDDMLASKDAISQIVKCFQQKQVDAVFGDLMYVDAGEPEKLHRIWKGTDFRKTHFHFGWMPGHPTFYIRKEVVEKFGGYQLKFGTAADYELMLRYLYKHEVSCQYLPKMIVKMRRGGQSNSNFRSRLRANRMDYLAMKENHLPMPMFSSIMKPVRKIPQFMSAFGKQKADNVM